MPRPFSDDQRMLLPTLAAARVRHHLSAIIVDLDAQERLALRPSKFTASPFAQLGEVTVQCGFPKAVLPCRWLYSVPY